VLHRWTELTNPGGGSTVPIQHEEELEYGDIVPGVTCPSCGGELVHSSNGAFCDECQAYVPIVGSAVHVEDDTDDDSDWTEEE
jgi:hypothetical protein